MYYSKFDKDIKILCIQMPNVKLDYLNKYSEILPISGSKRNQFARSESIH